jgi:hypothetical protein
MAGDLVGGTEHGVVTGAPFHLGAVRATMALLEGGCKGVKAFFPGPWTH